jgi:hypothetical protein
MTRPFNNTLFLFVFAIFFIVSGYQLSVSMMHSLLEDELRNSQQREIVTNSYSTWATRESLVSLLVKLSPYNGLILQNSARFYVLGADIALFSPDTTPFVSGHRLRALQLIRESLVRQPIWSLAWMDLSFIKALSGQFDDEFQSAFARALRTGGAERDILRGISELGFAHWRNLTPVNQQLFLTMLDTAVKREPQYVMDVAARHGRKFIPCLAIREKLVVAEFCKNFIR